MLSGEKGSARVEKEGMAGMQPRRQVLLGDQPSARWPFFLGAGGAQSSSSLHSVTLASQRSERVLTCQVLFYVLGNDREQNGVLLSSHLHVSRGDRQKANTQGDWKRRAVGKIKQDTGSRWRCGRGSLSVSQSVVMGGLFGKGVILRGTYRA